MEMMTDGVPLLHSRILCLPVSHGACQGIQPGGISTDGTGKKMDALRTTIDYLGSRFVLLQWSPEYKCGCRWQRWRFLTATLPFPKVWRSRCPKCGEKRVLVEDAG